MDAQTFENVSTAVRTDAVRHIIAAAEDLGRDPSKWVELHKWNQLCEAERVPLTILYSLWGHLENHESRSLVTEIAERLPLEALGIFGFSILTAPRALDAVIAAVEGYQLIRRTNMSLSPVRTSRAPSSGMMLSWGSPANSVGAARSQESIAAHFVHGIRQLEVEEAIREVRFTHHAPRAARGIEEWFQCPVHFDSDVDAIIYDRDALDANPVLGNPAIHAHFRSQVREALGGLDRRTTRAEQVRALLEAAPDRSARDIARSLGMSERSMRRSLEQSGTSLGSLRDTHRQQQTLRLLSESTLSLTQVAFELGYSDASALSRACRRWFSRSPSALRRELHLNRIESPD